MTDQKTNTDQKTKKAGEKLTGLLEHLNFVNSGRRHVLSSRPFWSLASGVSNSLSFCQFFESDSFQGRQVEEDVVTVSYVDESKALVRQPLDRAFCHLICFLKKNSRTW